MHKAITISPETREFLINGGWAHCNKIFHHSCAKDSLIVGLRFIKTFYKLYIVIHLVPLLLYKRKQLRAKPFETIKRTLWSYTKSLMFIFNYLIFLRFILCKLNNASKSLSDINASLCTFIPAPALLWESESRRVEITIYLLARYFETLWNFLRKRSFVPHVPGGEIMVFAGTMGVMNCIYQNDEKAIKETYLAVFKKFWGKN